MVTIHMEAERPVIVRLDISGIVPKPHVSLRLPVQQQQLWPVEVVVQALVLVRKYTVIFAIVPKATNGIHQLNHA